MGVMAVERISFWRGNFQVNVVLVKILSLLAPILNPLFIQVLLEPIDGFYFLKGAAGLAMLGVNGAAVFEGAFVFTFSFSSKNKLSRIRSTAFTVR